METKYKIIGGDGREYGPVTLDELKGWIRDGRVGPQTQILRSDLNQWLPAMQFQELQAELPAYNPAAPVEIHAEAVGFWSRFCAVIIDGIVIYLVFWAIWIPLSGAMNWQGDVKFDPNTFRGVEDLMPLFLAGAKQTVLSFILRLIYEVGMTGKFGATLGKMVIGAKIVRADGSRLGYDFALYRFLAKIISDFTCYIGYLMVAFRDDKRALHDLIAKTRVIYKR
jgi:uncharacterized RDD family membrane protein YckC